MPFSGIGASCGPVFYLLYEIVVALGPRDIVIFCF